MKLKNSYFYTIKENIKDEDSISGNLLVRSGMIKRTSSGVYMFLPLGYKVLDNIKKIIREEMNKKGAQELLMPSLIQEEVYKTTGRRTKFGNDMFSFKDRFGKDYCLGPTHEELFTMAATYHVKSYKDLHFNLYQIADKFRDEPRPRYGLLRVREFLMKDAYSFDTDELGLDLSYKDMYDAYKNIFNRMKINYLVVESDSGAMGGLLSEEFQAINPAGEDKLVFCTKCSYTSNIDIAYSKEDYKISTEKEKSIEKVYTPNMKTIEEISNYMSEDKNKFIKSLIYKADDKFYMVLTLGNDEVNETKLKRVLKCSSLELATDDDIESLGYVKGFIGPIDSRIKVIADKKIKYIKNGITGANKKDYHIKNVNLKDYNVDRFEDITFVSIGDKCPICGEKLLFENGIEIGNLFKLGTKYSESLNLNYSDEHNKLNPVYMGCYGIGLGRCMAAIVEEHHDDKGIIWPMEIAPYKVGIVLINSKDEEMLKNANDLYNKLKSLGIDTLLDDRDERPGVKFNDMDLIGIPIRIVIGNKVKEGIVEYKNRDSNEVLELSIKDAIEKIKENVLRG